MWKSFKSQKGLEMLCGIGFSAVNETRYSHTVAALHSTHQSSMATHILHVYSVVSCAQILAERGMMHGSRCHNHMYAISMASSSTGGHRWEHYANSWKHTLNVHEHSSSCVYLLCQNVSQLYNNIPIYNNSKNPKYVVAFLIFTNLNLYVYDIIHYSRYRKMHIVYVYWICFHW